MFDELKEEIINLGGRKLRYVGEGGLVDRVLRMIDEIENRLTPVAPDRAEARDSDGESPTRAPGEHDG